MKEKHENYILYGLLVVVIIGALLSFTGFSKGTSTATGTTTENKKETSFDPISTGTTDPGDVSVELTPIGIENGQLKVLIAMNTHSVTLSDFDLKQITTLEYNGKSIKPVSAPSLDGHHPNGDLVFNIGESLNSFKIIIEGIPKVEERVFTW